MTPTTRLERLLGELARFPWATTAQTLLERFREDRLGLTASSLTFTTLTAMVPFFAVALAVFTAFPIFGHAEHALQKWLIDSLIPPNISRQVLGYLTQFAGQASKLGVAGLAVLLVTAIALVLTIDKTLNAIWRVRRPRPLAQRVLIYWAAITLGPLVLGGSLALTSYAVTASRGVVSALPGGVRLLLDTIEFLVFAGGLAAMYRYVPNTQVRWGHAWAGGLFVSICIEIAKKLLALYLAAVPTYSVVYGTFATLPILLLWVYLTWIIVLLGAVIAAYLPSLLTGVERRVGGHGWQFQLAVEVLQQLYRARDVGMHGIAGPQLARLLRVDPLQLAPALEALAALDWIGQLTEVHSESEPRWVLLADPDATLLDPLIARLLLERADSIQNFWRKSWTPAMYLRSVL